MKTPLALITLASMQNISAQQGSILWDTRVQQIQIDGAVDAPRLVNRVGTQPSLPIGEKGSIFQLWGWKTQGGQVIYEELIGSTQVGTYLPKAVISTVTGDPFEAFSRSRVDVPFSVAFNVSGLLSQNAPSNLPEASTKVLVEHHTDLYVNGTFDGKSVESTRLVSQHYIAKNGVTTFSFPSTNLTAPGGNVAMRAGQERFVVYALADVNVPQRIIAESVVQIYPYPSGEIKGIDETKEYVTLPDFQAYAERVYPGSSTWVEIYLGDYDPVKRGEKFPNTRETQDLHPVAMVNLEFKDFIPRVQPDQPGEYTLVLRTSSPFPGESITEGGIVLSHTPIKLHNSIRINSSVTTME